MPIIFRNLQGNPHTPINTDTGEVLVRDGAKVKKQEFSHLPSATRIAGTVPMTRDEYLSQFGMEYAGGDYNIDKTRIPHGETQRQREKRLQEQQDSMNEYTAKRNEKIREYEEKLASGEFRQPTLIESALKRAQGHPDNESVQAARRVLEKKGIDWKTGKPLANNPSTEEGPAPKIGEIKNKNDFIGFMEHQHNIKLSNDTNDPLNQKRNYLYTSIPKEKQHDVLYFLQKWGFPVEHHVNDNYWINIKPTR